MKYTDIDEVDLKFIGFYGMLALIAGLVCFNKTDVANILVPLAAMIIRDLYRSSTSKDKNGKEEVK